MSAEFWAILTAVCWSVGSFFEKSGVKLGAFSPVMGTTIRTAVSFLILAVISFPYWPQLKQSGPKPVLMIALGGGVLAGAAGIFSLYKALSSGQLSIVLTLAFCLTPVIGAILGILFLKERLSLMQVIGICLTLTGSVMTAYFRKAVH